VEHAQDIYEERYRDVYEAVDDDIADLLQRSKARETSLVIPLSPLGQTMDIGKDVVVSYDGTPEFCALSVRSGRATDRTTEQLDCPEEGPWNVMFESCTLRACNQHVNLMIWMTRVQNVDKDRRRLNDVFGEAMIRAVRIRNTVDRIAHVLDRQERNPASSAGILFSGALLRQVALGPQRAAASCSAPASL
jgi:hypothetical protein